MASLQSKHYQAKIGRFVIHDYGFASRVEHPGDEYRIDFIVGVAKDFVIRAPAGKYSFRRISQRLAGSFGIYDGCHIDGIANFEIRPGKTVYVGQLVIAAAFKQDRRWVIAQTNLGRIPRSLPEAALSMKGSVIDRKMESLRAVRTQDAVGTDAVDTELMIVDGRDKWDCVQEPPNG